MLHNPGVLAQWQGGVDERLAAQIPMTKEEYTINTLQTSN